jgi:hypothetical protein
MSKYKVEIEIDVDFDSIFANIPEGLFSSESKGSDEYYEIECIADVLREAYTNQLMKQMKNMTDKKYAAHLKHHDECAVAVGKQIYENMKITKVS